MRINRIVLNNFGSYEDECIFDFSKTNESNRIILIGGKNGAGKTTLFNALQVCLYGHYAFGYKNAGKLYCKEILSHINNRAQLDYSKSASVTVLFSHYDARNLHEYCLERSWTWLDGNVHEEFKAVRNGISLSQEEADDFQKYLLHLIPPDLLKLYFFDGEKIADYFLSQQNINIHDALMVLSGNDTFDILFDAVKRVFNINKTCDSGIAANYVLLQDKITVETKALNARLSHLAELEEEGSALEAQYESLVSSYSKRGGITLEKWKELQSRLKEEEEHRERINWQRKSIATDILPFIIAHKLTDRILPQIKVEEVYQAETILKEKLRSPELEKSINAALSKVGVASATGTAVIMDAISSALIDNSSENVTPILLLSDDEKIQIHSVLARVSSFERSSFVKYQTRLQKSIEISKSIREELQKSDIEHFEEYNRETASLEKQIAVTKQLVSHTQEEIDSCIEKLDSLGKELQSARKAFEGELKKESIVDVSGKVLVLLDELKDIVYHQLIQNVQADLQTKFAQLIRKKSFFDDIVIDSSFDVHILRNQSVSSADLVAIFKGSGIEGLKQNLGSIAVTSLLGNEIGSRNRVLKMLSDLPIDVILPVEIDKDLMSSGEKQIFVMSLYWALMRQSKNDLPFVIDTPFARIDTEHRENITSFFFMDLPGQLLILSTNEELNGHHVELMRDQVAQVFTLDYSEDKRTFIRENQYFEV